MTFLKPRELVSILDDIGELRQYQFGFSCNLQASSVKVMGFAIHCG